MPPPDLPSLLGEVRDLTARYAEGKRPASFDAFRELLALLLTNTILDDVAYVRLVYGPRGRDEPAIGGAAGPTDPLLLRDGHYLALGMGLYIEETEHGPRVKVRTSKFQYQLDADGDHWVFRYDYLRIPRDKYPPSHLQINATGHVGIPEGMTMHELHFPTHRVSIEAVIRLLIDQYGVPSRWPAEIWRPLLAESEAAFLNIAHQNLSGPTR